ncbi:hypothetical protein FRX31_016248 [Thalictrum thalictroides]|uniref:Uncharacterized protein n=1 Tax=Thalictrum thalictroides TaxID=46969 RepID=A0A7J6WB18_THATH|nr:hypothetical protein FRX31_016248 [Thalictrum thalictroides]
MDFIEKVFDLIKGIIFCLLGCLLFAAGFHRIIKDHQDNGNISTTITGGLVFNCLGLFSFILGVLVLYCVCIGKTPDELGPSSEKIWFIALWVAMSFLSVSGFLTFLWGVLSIIDSHVKATNIVNMVMVILVGLLIGVFPIVLLKILMRPVQSLSKISPV